MINNRQAGRRRGRGNTNNGGGGGGQRHGGGGQGGRDTGNRIDSRARGNASQMYEKYKNLARDAQQQGDRVNIEYYLQFADHYFRVLSEQRARLEESQPNHQPQPRRQQPFDLDGDDDYGDEGEPIRAGEQQGQGGYNGQNGGQNGTRQDRDDRPQRQDRYEGQRSQRDDRPRDDRPQRNDRPREERPREDRVAQARDDQQGGQQAAQQDGGQPPRERQPRGDYRDAQPRDAVRRGPRAAVADDSPQFEADDVQLQSPVETQAGDGAPQPEPIAAQEEQPRRRGRPRRDRSAEEAASTPPAFDADRLPPSLGIASSPAPATVDGEAEEKPRRRRVRAAAPEATDAN